MLNECHISTDNNPAEDQREKIKTILSNLLESIGYSEEWIESFLYDLLNAKDNPEQDKLEAKLDQVNVIIDEMVSSAREFLLEADNDLATADEEFQEELIQTEKDDLELLKIRREEQKDK